MASERGHLVELRGFVPGDLAPLGIASSQLSRTITRDRVLMSLLRPLRGSERGKGTGVRHPLGELLSCPFCLTRWVAAAELTGLCVAPWTTRFAASVRALRTVAKIAREGATAQVDRREKVSKLVARPSWAA